MNCSSSNSSRCISNLRAAWGNARSQTVGHALIVCRGSLHLVRSDGSTCCDRDNWRTDEEHAFKPSAPSRVIGHGYEILGGGNLLTAQRVLGSLHDEGSRLLKKDDVTWAIYRTLGQKLRVFSGSKQASSSLCCHGHACYKPRVLHTSIA